MEVVLFRHGDALDVGVDGVKTDAERPLSDKGRRQTQRAALGLERMWPGPVTVWTSPLVRARQTAEIVAEVLGAGGPRVHEALGPGGRIEHLAKDLAIERHVLVGHEPSLSEWTSLLTVGTTRLHIEMPKSGAVLLRLDAFEHGRAMLVWAVPHRAYPK